MTLKCKSAAATANEVQNVLILFLPLCSFLALPTLILSISARKNLGQTGTL